MGNTDNVVDIEDFNFEGERDETTFIIHMLAGSIAGLMEHVAMYPIDTIKVYRNNKFRFICKHQPKD